MDLFGRGRPVDVIPPKYNIGDIVNTPYTIGVVIGRMSRYDVDLKSMTWLYSIQDLVRSNKINEGFNEKELSFYNLKRLKRLEAIGIDT